MEVRQERTHWRDLSLNDRHRQWGYNCPMTDIDLLTIEYDSGTPKALVEYKHERAAPQYSTHPTYRALTALGNDAGLPVFAVRYADDFAWFRVVPLNDRARAWTPERREMTEREWVELLYKVRGRELPREVFDTLEEI